MPTPPPVERSAVSLSAGDISVLTAGDPAAAPALFLHGIPASAELWRDVLAMIAAEGYRVVAPDLPGYGATEMAEGYDYSLPSVADTVAELVGELFGGPTWVVAQDIGGGVAQQLAIRRPGTIARLSLSNAIAGDSWPVRSAQPMFGAARWGLFAPMARVGLFPYRRIKAALRPLIANPAYTSDAALRRIFYDGKFDRGMAARRFQRMLRATVPRDTVSIAEDLRGVDHPVDLIWGMRDRFQPWAGPGRFLAERLPRAQIVQLAGAGHYLQLDAPGAYVRALLTGRS